MRYGKIEALFNSIAKSSLFRTDGESIDVVQTLIELCDAIKQQETDEFIWGSLGECGEFCLADLISCAYWASAHCHDGQYSLVYLLCCNLGSIYSPGMESEPDEGDDNYWLYVVLCNELLKG